MMFSATVEKLILICVWECAAVSWFILFVSKVRNVANPLPTEHVADIPSSLSQIHMRMSSNVTAKTLSSTEATGIDSVQLRSAGRAMGDRQTAQSAEHQRALLYLEGEAGSSTTQSTPVEPLPQYQRAAVVLDASRGSLQGESPFA